MTSFIIPSAPPRLIVEPVLRLALTEDLGRTGDITTAAIVPPDHTTRAVIISRQSGILAGMDCAALAMELLDPRVTFSGAKSDSDTISSGDIVASLQGCTRSILAAERTILNIIGHLSGIATATAQMVALVSGTNARIASTRKTTPGLRALEKYAVRCGGGVSHRFGLDDGVLIKDNHVAVAGSPRHALDLVRRSVGHMVKIEVEVDHIDQIDELLAAPPDAILLDNMDTSELSQAVEKIGQVCLTEASGSIKLETIAEVAATGVDLISVGWITHSAPRLDVSLDVA